MERRLLGWPALLLVVWLADDEEEPARILLNSLLICSCAKWSRCSRKSKPTTRDNSFTLRLASESSSWSLSPAAWWSPLAPRAASGGRRSRCWPAPSCRRLSLVRAASCASSWPASPGLWRSGDLLCALPRRPLLRARVAAVAAAAEPPACSRAALHLLRAGLAFR